MSQKQIFAQAFLKSLAGSGTTLNPTLEAIFSKILASQVTIAADGTATPTAIYSILAKTFTFVATPAANRPTSPNDYTQEAIDTATAAGEAAVADAPIDPVEPEPEPEVPVDGETFMLTKGLDNLVGTDDNDLFIGSIDANNADLNTASPIDTIDGGAGIDTVKISSIDAITGISDLPVMSNVEKLSVLGAKAVTLNTTSNTDLTDVIVTKGLATSVTASNTQDVDVSGVTGTLAVVGGKDVNVTDASTSTGIDIGTTTAPAGKVTVTDTDTTASAITVKGGSEVTVNAASLSATAADITVAGSADTKVVTVNQTSTTTPASKTVTTAEVKASQAITFKDVAKDTAITVAGLTFTTTKALSATEVAAAFANLDKVDTQSTTGIVANGIYTGSVDTGWTSGAATGATVTFTGAASSTVAFSAPTATVSGSSVVASVPASTYTAGTAEVSSTTPATTTAVSKAVISGDELTSVTVDGYAGSSTITNKNAGDGVTLTDISLANSAENMIISTASTELNLTVNNLGTAPAAATTTAAAVPVAYAETTITDASLVTLNATTATADSYVKLVNAEFTNLTVKGTNTLNLDPTSTLTALDTVTVSGQAGLSVTGAAIKTVDASATSGNVSVSTADESVAYKGSTAKDSLTITAVSGAISGAIDLSTGDDTVTLADATTAHTITGTIKGGAGTDTIAMNVTNAASLLATGAASFATSVTEFERLTITDATTSGNALAIDVEAIGGYDYVTTNGTAATAGITLNNMANNGTVVLAATNDTNGVTVGVKNALAGTADVLNLVLQSNSDNSTSVAAIATVENVETINVSAVESYVNTAGVITGSTAAQSLALDATSATSVVVTGDDQFTLTTANATSLTNVDASAMTAGGLIYVATATEAATLKGGAGNDTLTATYAESVLTGGAGNDTLIVSDNTNAVSLSGGEGKDTYVLGTLSNQNAYATISGTEAELVGDVIVFGSVTGTTVTNNISSFNSEKITLGTTASFDSLVNEATKGDGSTNAIVSYFTFTDTVAGTTDTYVVFDNSDATTFDTTGKDSIVKISGVVDLTFNDTTNVLEIA